MTERRDYDALAEDINLKDITSCERNANILRMLRDGDPNWNKKLFIVNEDLDEENMNDFLVEEGDDLGLLGYFIGQCEVLEKLFIYYLPGGRDEINRFFEGMSQNRSIEYLEICNHVGDDGWSRLGGFLENNRTLLHLDLADFGQQGEQNIALAFGRMQQSSLKHLSMNSTEISDQGFAEIATVLRLQPQLKNLELSDNNIGRDGCIALGNALSSWPASNNLEALNLSCNVINDEGLQALVAGMMNCCSLKRLNLSNNQSITAAGLISLSPLLQSESNCLETLHLCRIDFGDDGAIALAEGLRDNTSLKELWLSPETSGITAVGWSAFSRLLCDTSTINNTYLSNHKLSKIGCYGDDNEGIAEEIQMLLTTNRYQTRQTAAFCKILRSHPDLDMEPLFKLKMQFVPAVISWFDRVENIGIESERSCQSRKLSALYKFVRGMTDLAVIGYWEGRVIEIEANKCRIADERRRLQDEMRRLDAKERRLEYEEKVTLERLGDQPLDELNRNKRMRLK